MAHSDPAQQEHQIPRGSFVRLPEGAEPPYEVFITGVPQQQGTDYVVEGDCLHFTRELEQEGKLGFWRWLFMFLGIAGSYRKNDVIDVTYNKGTQRLIKTGLKLEPGTPAG